MPPKKKEGKQKDYIPEVQWHVRLRGENLTDGHFYEFEWNPKVHVRVTPNKNGTTGFATILASTNPAILPGVCPRIHYCLFNPCTAGWTSKSKYGEYGEPMHLQIRAPDTGLPAVAAPSGSNMPLPAPPTDAEFRCAVLTRSWISRAKYPCYPCYPCKPLLAAVLPAVAEAAVSESPTAIAEPTPAPPTEATTPMAEPAAVAQPAAVVPPGELQTATPELAAPVVDRTVEVLKDQVKAPDCPQKAPLHCIHPAAPMPPDLDPPQPQSGESATAVAVTAVLPSPVAAKHRIESKLLALAREIRRPRAYVGYSAFILMGLLKKQRPCVWEGTNFIDLLQVFAPWALESCTSTFPMTAIACTLIAQSGGGVELAPICEQYPLVRTGHFVAGIDMPVYEVTEPTCSFESLYASIGVACVATVVDGDCGLDVMTMMLGIAASFSARKDLRIEISDYLIARIGEPWLHDVMAACQELCQEDVNLYRKGDTQIVAAAIAPPTAVAEPAALADETTEKKLMRKPLRHCAGRASYRMMPAC